MGIKTGATPLVTFSTRDSTSSSCSGGDLGCKLTNQSKEPYKGKRFPTYFKFRGKDYGYVLKRECDLDKRCRIPFETDAQNDYFSRDIDPGEFALRTLRDGALVEVDSYTLNIQNGTATLTVAMPAGISVGMELTFLATVNDSTQLSPFENRFLVKVNAPTKKKGKSKKTVWLATGRDRRERYGPGWKLRFGRPITHRRGTPRVPWRLHG
jgi:hypothetical protein